MVAIAILAATDTIWHRLGFMAVAVLVGALLVLAGLANIRTQTAEEDGKRRLTNWALGRSNDYEGAKAVRLGWIRVICGVALILFGIVFVFVGPFLAE